MAFVANLTIVSSFFLFWAFDLLILWIWHVFWGVDNLVWASLSVVKLAFLFFFSILKNVLNHYLYNWRSPHLSFFTFHSSHDMMVLFLQTSNWSLTFCVSLFTSIFVSDQMAKIISNVITVSFHFIFILLPSSPTKFLSSIIVFTVPVF